MEHLGKFLISFFPLYLLVSDGYLVSPAAVYPGALALDHARALVQAPDATNNAYFLCCFEFESKRVLKRLD